MADKKKGKEYGYKTPKAKRKLTKTGGLLQKAKENESKNKY